MEVTFSEDTKLEEWGTYISLYDADNNELGIYTGAELAGKTLKIKGNTIKIHMFAEEWAEENYDGYYGFSIDQIRAWMLPDIEAVDLSVNTLPDYVTYCIGEKLNLKGLTLDLELNNGEIYTISSNEVTIDDYDFSSAGEKTITVYYQDFAVQFNVTVLSTVVVEIPSSEYPESSHPYYETDETYIYTCPGALKMEVTFSEDTELEEWGTYISLYDADNNELGTYTGAELAGKTLKIKGNTIKIHMFTEEWAEENYDGYYGFSIDQIVAYVKGTDTGIELKIITQPADYTGAVGEKAVFTVEAEGEGLTYQWQYKNANASTWKNSGQEGNKTEALSVPITAAREGQQYRCVVTDTNGESVTSEAAALHVENSSENANVKIVSQPVDYIGEMGTKAAFSIKAEGNGLTYQWQYKNADAFTWKNSSQSGNKTAALTVPITAARDGQSYRCVVTDTNGNSVTSEAAVLHVGIISGEGESTDVKITSQPEDYTGEAGTKAAFSVKAEGEGLTYQWQYKNADASSWKNSSQSGNKTAALTVPITAARDGQSYRCVVTGASGNSIISVEAVLHVGTGSDEGESTDVKIVAQPDDYTGAVGEKAVFTVEAEGEGLTYQWQYKNADASTWKNSSQSGNKTATLTVPITAARNGQSYRCVVTVASGNTVTSNVGILYVTK